MVVIIVLYHNENESNDSKSLPLRGPYDQPVGLALHDAHAQAAREVQRQDALGVRVDLPAQLQVAAVLIVRSIINHITIIIGTYYYD